jgi:endonuclease G
MALGNPTNAGNAPADTDNYLIDHKYYIESYNRTKAEPNWVSWHISVFDLGYVDRMNDFRPDTDLPADWYEVENADYKRSGFDKGHNCPSGDRTSSAEANSSTFLMDNIIPQAPKNNQHVWEHLERYCRDKARSGNEVYVIMGSYGSGGNGRNGYAETIADGRINVPAHIWKIVLILPDGDDDLARIDEDTPLIAIDTPNDNDTSNNWMDYICTVKDIETKTGFKLFTALPNDVRSALEDKVFRGGN